MAEDSAIKPAGRTVKVWNDSLFKQLRLSIGVPDTFIDKGWDFENFKDGGGKGGGLMAFVGSHFVVKELSEGDHSVLLDITRSYYKHLTTGETRLCYFLMHFQDVLTGRKFVVMRNEVGSGSVSYLYDLKGCADDKTLIANGRSVKAVHKRIWNICMWCGQCTWTPERVTYYEGKVAAKRVRFALTGKQREQVLSAIKRDTEWLAQENLMDYSLLVAVKRGSPGTPTNVPCGQRPLVRMERDGSETAIYVSIIDFLQRWGPTKAIANWIKVLERNKATIKPEPYAERFALHFQDTFKAVE
mmetsp:Transcript_92813/g.206409  ORF Transcript_92813/g.206409 Transcript_92813/m.206409 type:complete len:300 (+) Transcript_92813:148-1047(+)